MRMKESILIIIVAAVLLFAGCAPDYTEEFKTMIERYDTMNVSWEALLDEAALITENPPSFDTVDEFYDGAIAHANTDLAELKDMLTKLDTYKDGINELDYADFKEILDDSINTTEVAIEYFVFDRGWVKAKSINETYNELVTEWNSLTVETKTGTVAEGYRTRMIELSEKLNSIQQEIDEATFDEMSGNIDSAIEAFDESITALEVQETE